MSDSSGHIGIGIGVVAVMAAAYYGPDLLKSGFKNEMAREGRRIKVVQPDYEEKFARMQEENERLHEEMREMVRQQMMNIPMAPHVPIR